MDKDIESFRKKNLVCLAERHLNDITIALEEINNEISHLRESAEQLERFRSCLKLYRKVQGGEGEELKWFSLMSQTLAILEGIRVESDREERGGLSFMAVRSFLGGVKSIDFEFVRKQSEETLDE